MKKVFGWEGQVFPKSAKELCYYEQKRGDDMIEIVCRENQLEEKNQIQMQLPKNIRQMGSPKGRHKIYVEDYVYTYLHSQAQKNTRCAAVLLGKSQVSKDIRYTFVYGAVECGQAVFQWENIYLDESFWQYIYEEERHYFSDSDIVGWFVGEQGKEAVLSANIESAHRKYFAGRDKVLMLLDGVEQEEIFYVYEQGYLQKKEGYYLYYEKNLPMQEYMVSKKEEERKNPHPPEEEPLWRSPESDKEEECSEWEALHKEIAESDYKEEIEEIREIKEIKEMEELSSEEKIFVKSSLEEPKTEAEKALQSYRNMVLEKQGRRVEQNNKRFLYTASSFLMLVICVIGITTVNNYRKMKEVESVLSVMKESVEEKKEPETKSASDVVVESIASGVKPLNQQENAKIEKKKADEKKEEKKKEESKEDETLKNVTGKDVNQEETGKEKEEKKELPTEQIQNSGEPEIEENQETTATPEPQYYIVQKGDTLESICQKVYQNKKMVQTLCQANGIENGDKILAGQKLVLP